MSRLEEHWAKNFLVDEFRLALLFEVGLVVWAVHFHGLNTIDRFLESNRGPVYSTAASIYGALFGFVITAISIVLSLSDDKRLSELRDTSHYEDLWFIFTSAVKVLSGATVSAFVGLLFDRDSSTGHGYHPNSYVFYIFCFFTILSVLRLGRCVWALDNTVKIVIKAAQDARKKEIEERARVAKEIEKASDLKLAPQREVGSAHDLQ